jgi:hypothetical protein
MGERYIFVKEDLSGFADWDYAIVDTSKGKYDDGSWKGLVCETGSVENAQLIVDALNAYGGK